MTEPIGLLVLDKPEGPTSHDVVAQVRRALHVRRVGHAGTLDPGASGVLLVGVGRATRLLRFLVGSDKSYVGTLELGSTTSTLDASGEPTGTYAMSGISAADVVAAARRFTGELSQLPPMVSAVHHEGRRLHELARAGIEVTRTPRRVRVDRYEVHHVAGLTYRFEVRCSSGTYVRSLVDDLGRALGGGAHLATLRRTEVGTFSLTDAVGLDHTEELAVALRPPASMVAHLGTVALEGAAAGSFVHGRRVEDGGGHLPDSELAVLGEDGELLGVARVDNGTLRPVVVLAPGGARDDD